MASRMVASIALIAPLLIGSAPASLPASAADVGSPAILVAAADKPPKGKQKKNGIAGAADSLVTDVGSLLGGKNASGKGKNGAGKGKNGGDSMGGAGKSKGKGKHKKS